jgi:hypothetical protein
LDDGKPLKSSFSYFDQPHSFSTFLQQGSKTTADFAGHDYGNVVYSPVGSATAETIMEEEIEMPSCNASRALGASAIRCMTGIACTIAISPTAADKSEHDEAAGFEQSFSGGGGSGGGGNSVSGADFEDVEDKVQRLFDMPDYTNVTVSDRNSRKYTPLQT